MELDLLFWGRVVVALTKSNKFKAETEKEEYNLSLLRKAGFIVTTWHNGQEHTLTDKGQELAAYAKTSEYIRTHRLIEDVLGSVPRGLFMTILKGRVLKLVRTRIAEIEEAEKEK